MPAHSTSSITLCVLVEHHGLSTISLHWQLFAAGQLDKTSLLLIRACNNLQQMWCNDTSSVLWCFGIHLNSSIMLFSGARPMQARKVFSSMALCLARALTTGVPSGTRGALARYDSSTATGWKPCSSLPSSLNCTSHHTDTPLDLLINDHSRQQVLPRYKCLQWQSIVLKLLDLA